MQMKRDDGRDDDDHGNDDGDDVYDMKHLILIR